VLTQAPASAGAQTATAVNLHPAPAAPATQPATAPATQAGPQAPTLTVSAPSAPATTQTPATAGAAPAMPARYGVPLERAVETVRMTIEVGVRQGFSQARIQLSPASLGGIKINLQRTSDGVVAKVVTDHQAAAQTLGQGGAELKRSLEAAGVNLVRLDIEARGDSGAASRDPSRTAPAARAASTADDDAPQAEDAGRTEHTLVLPGGALVNVLA
jgi:flagellar hook-length control protein FliK